MKVAPEKYQVITWRNPLMLHWIINPGLAFNELVLGQRMPTVQWVERYSDKPYFFRVYIPCPHCGTLHLCSKWSGMNRTAYKNWFGLYCDHCGQIIPCLWNLTSLVILLLTSPLWFLFKKRIQARWLAAQPARFQNLILEQEEVLHTCEKNKDAQKQQFLKAGILWGIGMFVFMLFTMPLFTEGDSIGFKIFLISIIFFICLIGGLLFVLVWSFMMKLIMKFLGCPK